MVIQFQLNMKLIDRCLIVENFPTRLYLDKSRKLRIGLLLQTVFKKPAFCHVELKNIEDSELILPTQLFKTGMMLIASRKTLLT